MAQEYNQSILTDTMQAPAPNQRNPMYAHYNSLPALIPPIPMQASGPAPEYNSSDAESLDEIPIEKGAAYGRPPFVDGYPYGANINVAASYPGGPVVPQYYRPRPMGMQMLRPLHKQKVTTRAKKHGTIQDVSPVGSEDVSPRCSKVEVGTVDKESKLGTAGSSHGKSEQSISGKNKESTLSTTGQRSQGVAGQRSQGATGQRSQDKNEQTISGKNRTDGKTTPSGNNEAVSTSDIEKENQTELKDNEENLNLSGNFDNQDGESSLRRARRRLAMSLR